MVTESQVRRIALFFLFALLDTKASCEAAFRVVAQLKASGARGQTGVSDVDLIRLLIKTQKSARHQLRQQTRAKGAESTSSTVGAEAWVPPSGLSLAPWQKFQREADELEVISVLLSNILGFGEDVVAKAMGVSLGTARYRLGRGVRHLGQITRQMAAASAAGA